MYILNINLNIIQIYANNMYTINTNAYRLYILIIHIYFNDLNINTN